MELAQASAASLPPGTQIAGYAIGERIGSGGFGEVYRARHAILGRVAAIKVLHRRYSHDPEAVARFVAEARAVNRVSHPGIVEVFDFGALDDGRQFCVMELVEGQTLRELLTARGRLSLDEALPILRGIAEAVDAAHGAGIAHRDLKPENVFVLPGGGVKLIDFGLAKLVDDTEPAITREGTVFGTPFYMSPEQCRGNATDLRTDTYSFGVVAYQLLTGELPFGGEALEVALHHVNDDPVPPSKRCAEVPPRADAPVLAAMTKEPADRPAALVAVVDALAGASTMKVPARRGRRGRLALAIAATVLVLGGGALALVQPWRGDARVTMVPGAGGRPYVVVADFASESGPDEAWRSDAVAEVLEPLLEASNGCVVTGRSEAHILIRDLSLPARDGHDRATLEAIRAHGPARYVVSGAISVDGATMRVRARLQDVVTGRTIAEVERGGDASRIAPIATAIASELRRRTGLAPLGQVDIDEASRLLPRDELVAHYSRAARARYRLDAAAAMAELTPVITAQPDFAPARQIRRWALEYGGQQNEAVIEVGIARDNSRGLPARRRDEIELHYHWMRRRSTEVAEVARRMRAARPADTLLAIDLAMFLGDVGHHDEAVELLEQLKRLPPPEGDDPMIDWAEAGIARFRHQLPAALLAARRGVARSRQKRARHALSENLTLEGQILNAMVKPDQAIVALVEATEVTRELGLMNLRPFFLLKDSYFNMARLDDARRVLDQIHELRQRYQLDGPTLNLAHHTFDQGLLFEAAGDVDHARSACSLARFLYVAAGELPAGLGSGTGFADGSRRCVANASRLAAGHRRPTVATARKAVDAARRSSGPELRTALEQLGNALWDAGMYAEAEARFDEVASLYDSTGQHRRAGWSFASMAEIVLDAGEPARARALALRAIDEFRRSAGELGEAYANHIIALALREEGDLAGARAAIAPSEAYVATLQNLEFRIRMLAWEAVVKSDLALADQALAEAVAIDNYTTITRAHLMRARVLRQLGRDAEARDALATVIERARHLGHGEWERQAKRLRGRR